jgi:hypothetical protein
LKKTEGSTGAALEELLGLFEVEPEEDAGATEEVVVPQAESKSILAPRTR